MVCEVEPHESFLWAEINEIHYTPIKIMVSRGSEKSAAQAYFSHKMRLVIHWETEL